MASFTRRVAQAVSSKAAAAALEDMLEDWLAEEEPSIMSDIPDFTSDSTRDMPLSTSSISVEDEEECMEEEDEEDDESLMQPARRPVHRKRLRVTANSFLRKIKTPFHTAGERELVRLWSPSDPRLL